MYLGSSIPGVGEDLNLASSGGPGDLNLLSSVGSGGAGRGGPEDLSPAMFGMLCFLGGGDKGNAEAVDEVEDE